MIKSKCLKVEMELLKNGGDPQAAEMEMVINIFCSCSAWYGLFKENTMTGEDGKKKEKKKKRKHILAVVKVRLSLGFIFCKIFQQK